MVRAAGLFNIKLINVRLQRFSARQQGLPNLARCSPHLSEDAETRRVRLTQLPAAEKEADDGSQL